MNELITTNNNQASIWETEVNLAQIKEIYGRGLSIGEFNTLVQIGRATGLNPFLREIWAVKYKDSPAQIFIGRDGYRKSAQRNPSYDYHVSDAVYSNDEFCVDNGEIKHKYNLAKRGELIGAYCVVKRKGASRTSYVFVELKEYSTGMSLWKSADQKGKPATMIKKVAESQALRAAFQELFAGTYSEEEAWDKNQTNTPKPKGVDGLKQKLGIVKEDETIIEAEFNTVTGEVIEEKIISDTESKMDADTLKFLLESATTKKDLLDAMKHLKDLKADEKKPVYEIYKAKDAELSAS